VKLKLIVKNGPQAGKELLVETGQSLSIGRTSRADVALSTDSFLSGVHFAVEVNGAVCRLVDRKSANGTYVNGAKVADAVLKEGDVINAGQTRFAVSIVEPARPPEPPPAPPQPQPTPQRVAAPAPPSPDSASAIFSSIGEEAFKSTPASVAEPAPPAPVPPEPPSPELIIGHWRWSVVPDGWEPIEGVGIRCLVPSCFPSEVTVTDEELSGSTFDRYVESQLEFVKVLVADPQISNREPDRVSGADECRCFVVRYKTDDGRRFEQRQTYARSGSWAGSLSMTTLESLVPRLQPVFDRILAGLLFSAAGAG